MKVVDNIDAPLTVPFATLQSGDTFDWNGRTHIRMMECERWNAVDSSGNRLFVRPDVRVIPLPDAAWVKHYKPERA